MSIYTSCSDTKLLELLSQSDRQAFDQLYNKYWEELYLTAFLVLRNKEASKDIVQEIFIWLWEKRKSFQIISLKPYLKAAVKFKVANYIRSGKIRKTFFDFALNINFNELSSSSEELLEVKELKELIHQVVTNLPEKCREIFRLSREENLSNQEISQRLKISIKTVENQMTIALHRLRHAIKPFLFILFFSDII